MWENKHLLLFFVLFCFFCFVFLFCFFFFWGGGGGGGGGLSFVFLQFDSLIRWVQLLFEGWLYQNFEGNLLPLVIFKGGGSRPPAPHPSGSAHERGNQDESWCQNGRFFVLFTKHIGLCVIFDRAYPGSEGVLALRRIFSLVDMITKPKF